MEANSLDATDRFLSWHRSGEPLPLDRTVRDYARAAKDTVAASTAARHRQFAERLAGRLGAVDLRLLQKEDIGVDLGRGEITIRLKVHSNVLGAPKTAASNRTIEIPQRLIEFLKIHRERQRADDGWVFLAARNPRKHWDDLKYQEAWRRLRKKSEVRPLGTHAWRHLFISNALSSDGWTPAEVAEHVGSSIKVILERYAHVVRRSRRLDFSFVDDLES